MSGMALTAGTSLGTLGTTCYKIEYATHERRGAVATWLLTRYGRRAGRPYRHAYVLKSALSRDAIRSQTSALVSVNETWGDPFVRAVDNLYSRPSIDVLFDLDDGAALDENVGLEGTRFVGGLDESRDGPAFEQVLGHYALVQSGRVQRIEGGKAGKI